MQRLDFKTIIQVYQLEGMVALGKMLNPATNELTPNVDHARYVIDILEILKAKTTGNLDDAESKFLEQTLSTLKLNFVEMQSSSEAPSNGEA